MNKHERARNKLLCSRLTLDNGLIIGDTYKFISDYIGEAEATEKLLNLYRNLSMETDVAEREKYWYHINELEKTFKSR